MQMESEAASQASRNRSWPGWLLALLGPPAALGLRLALGGGLSGYPFLTFYAPILLAAFVGGFGPGLVAILLSGLLCTWFLLPPSDALPPATASDWLGLGLFLLVTLLMTGLIHAMQLATRRARGSEAALRRLNQELEQRVAARTHELAAANAQLTAEMRSREAAEARVRQTQKMEALGQLTGGVAHDFNNMLAIVIGSLDIAQRRLRAGRSDVLKQIDNAMDGARRAAVLTQRLLAFSRRSPLMPVVADVNALVGGMSELLRRTLGEPIELECVLAGGLWRTRVDPGQLESAILNLAVNARDAMPEGGKLTIETMNAHLDDDYAAAHAEVSAGQYVAVAVSDTGTGMPPEVIARAFDPFFTTKKTGLGTGLGLSQVYGFVKQSGGHVKIYSEPGQGTNVKIYLPRETAAGVLASVDGMPAPSLVPAGSPEEIILVVEDDDRVRGTTVSALRELGYTVRHAASGEQALGLLEDLPQVRLLFTDVVMPGMSGRALAEEAARRHPGLKVLYTTGYTANAIVHNGIVDRGVELIPKPFALDQLARKVRSVLDGGERR
jgi:signal transduction histidine kinase